MRSFFVSASVPDPKRDPKYYDTADVVAIRDAITALVQIVTPLDRLVFGGHPAITRMVARVAEAMETLDNVSIYQSAWYAPFFPEENAAFKSLAITRKEETLAESMKTMRQAMLYSTPFDAAFFVGGMEGVETEFSDIRRLPIVVPCFPLATTGAAAHLLAIEHEAELRGRSLDDLFVSYDYAVLVRRLLDPENIFLRDMRYG